MKRQRRKNRGPGMVGGKCVVNREHAFLYVDVPKVASTSIKAALLPLFPDVEPGGDSTGRGVAHLAFGGTPHRMSRPKAEARFPDYFVFAFVRNPWDRLLSCYHSKTKPRRIALWQHEYPGGEFFPGMSFEEFCGVAAATPDAAANVHYRSQHTFLGDRVDFVGRFERLAEDFAEVCRQLGISLELPHVNPNRLGIRTYREHYDERLAALVGERYREDIRRFGYSF